MRPLLLLVLLLGVGSAAVAWWWLGRDARPVALPDRMVVVAANAPTTGTSTAAPAAHGEVAAGVRSTVAVDAPPLGHGNLYVLAVLEDRAPLPHVAVRLTARDGRQQGTTERVGITGVDGSVSFLDLDVGPWHVQLDRNLEALVQIVAGQITEQRFTVPRGLTALARVLDGSGQRIAGASVSLWSASGFLDAPAMHSGAEVGTTDSNGELLLHGLPSFGGHGCWLAASHPRFGWSPARMVAIAKDDQDTTPRLLELQLGLGGAFVTVQVRDEQQQPVAHATAVLRPVDRPDSRADGAGRVLSHLQRRGRTDPSGQCGLGPLPPCDYRLEVTGAGFERFQATLRVEDDQPRTRTVVLAAEARVHARVVAADGKPVSGVAVQVQVEPSGGDAVTGPDGRCELGGLSPGSGAFVAIHDQFERATGAIELVRGATAELAVKLAALPAIRGRVVDEADQPLPGFGLRATAQLPGYEQDQRSAVSAADGGFVMPASIGLDYQLAVSEPGCLVPLQGAVPTAVRVRDEPWLVRVPRDARGSAFVEGVLVDGEGRPAFEGRYLSLRGDGFTVHPGRQMAAPVVDGATGQFRLGPLPPGSYTLSFGGQPSFLVPGVVLRAHATTQLGQVVVPAAGTLRVEVTASPGLRLAEVMVQVDGDGDSDFFRVDEARTGNRLLLLPGRYRVVVYGTGFRWLEQDVEITAGAVSLVRGELRPAVRVGLRFCMPAGERGAVFRITDAGGAVVCTHELEDGAVSEDLWPFFEVGTFPVAITGSSGQRYRSQFTVTSLEPSEGVRELRGEVVR